MASFLIHKKNITTIILIFLLSLNSSFLYSQNNIVEYNIEDFSEAVLENNIQIKISQEKMKLTKLSEKEAISVFLPQINAQATTKHNFNEQLMYIEFPDYENIDPITGEIPVVLQEFNVGFNNDFQAHLLVEQNIFNLKSIYDLKAAQQSSQIGELQNENNTKEILVSARKSFLQTVLMQQVYEINKLSEQNAKSKYIDAKNKYDNKLISEFEMLQTKISWEEEIPKTLQSERNTLILLSNLKFLAGLNSDDSLVLKHDLSNFEQANSNVRISQSLKNRPDYKMLETNVDLQSNLVKNSQSEFYPTLSLNGGYSYLSNSNEWNFNENKNKYLYAELKLTVPIFSGGYRRTQIAKSKIEYNNSQLQKQEAELSMTIEIENLELKLAEELKIIEVTKSTLTTAKKAYQIAVSMAENGLISQIDFRKIRNDYKKAEINLFNSIYNYKCTQIDFNKAIGNF